MPARDTTPPPPRDRRFASSLGTSAAVVVTLLVFLSPPSFFRRSGSYMLAFGGANLDATNPLDKVDCGRRYFSRRRRSTFSDSSRSGVAGLDDLPVGGHHGVSVNGSSSGGRQLFPGPTLNIVNGEDSVHGQWPFNARLHMTKNYLTGPRTSLCSGSVISKRFVLTAAHCTYGYDAPDVKVWVRDLYTDKEEDPPGLEMEVERLINHPQYLPKATPVGIINDIALIKLAKELTFDEYLQPICLPPRFDWLTQYDWFQDMHIVGWGLTKGFGSKPSTLQWAKTTTIPYPLCFFLFIPVRVMPFHMCGMPRSSGRGIGTVCNGDSGGPMVAEGTDGRQTVVGITSFGFPGCFKFIPSVYTRVSWHLDWIGKNLDPDQNVPGTTRSVLLELRGTDDGDVSQDGGLELIRAPELVELARSDAGGSSWVGNETGAGGDSESPSGSSVEDNEVSDQLTNS